MNKKLIRLLAVILTIGALIYSGGSSFLPADTQFSLTDSKAKSVDAPETISDILNEAAKEQDAQDKDKPRRVILTPSRSSHILYGDHNGGGHKHGIGRPCKSEFPADWGDTKIISLVKRIAANDNLDWREEHNGYYVTETMQEEVKVRVVLGPKKERIITAYPTNVKRNPCPANDR